MKLVKQNFKFKEGEVVGLVIGKSSYLFSFLGDILVEKSLQQQLTTPHDKETQKEIEDNINEGYGKVYTLSSAQEVANFISGIYPVPKKQNTILLSTVKEKDIIVIRDTIDDRRYKWVKVREGEYILIGLYGNLPNLTIYSSLEDFILRWGDRVEVFVCESVEESVNFLLKK